MHSIWVFILSFAQLIIRKEKLSCLVLKRRFKLLFKFLAAAQPLALSEILGLKLQPKH